MIPSFHLQLLITILVHRPMFYLMDMIDDDNDDDDNDDDDDDNDDK